MDTLALDVLYGPEDGNEAAIRYIIS